MTAQFKRSLGVMLVLSIFFGFPFLSSSSHFTLSFPFSRLSYFSILAHFTLSTTAADAAEPTLEDLRSKILELQRIVLELQVKIKRLIAERQAILPAEPIVFQSFDGIDDFAEYPDQSVKLKKNFEISFLFRAPAASEGIIVGAADESRSKFWNIALAVDTEIFEAWTSDGIKTSSIYAEAPINDGRWHRVIWKKRGDSQTIIVDGVDRTTVRNIERGIADINPSSPIIIGGDPLAGDGFFKGDIAEVRMISD